MASLPDRVMAVAKALIVTAGAAHAVAATDIRSRAELLHHEYADYSLDQIKNRIADEIRKQHQPGISGSV